MKLYEDVWRCISYWKMGIFLFFFFSPAWPQHLPGRNQQETKNFTKVWPPKRRRNNHQFWGDFFFNHAHRMPPHGTRAWYIYGSMGWRRFLQVFMYVGRYLIKTRPMDAYRACFFLPIYYICFITCVWVHQAGGTSILNSSDRRVLESSGSSLGSLQSGLHHLP